MQPCIPEKKKSHKTSLKTEIKSFSHSCKKNPGDMNKALKPFADQFSKNKKVNNINRKKSEEKRKNP